MLYKSRTIKHERLILKSLHRRMELTENVLQYYLNLEKGDAGERHFDLLTDTLTCECFILNDLQLSYNHSTFQIDTLLITGETLYLFEVKNYEGDFYYERDRIYTKSKSEINNPLLQLKRCESLFRQLLLSLGLEMQISPYVIFVNPEFTLYQASLNAPFIFPTQIRKFFKQLNSLSAKLNGKHRKLAEKLASLHMQESSFLQLPKYTYDQLRKGILCSKCGSFSCRVQGRRVVCEDCGCVETVEAAVLRSIREFQMLFPERKITTKEIYDWCKIVDSKKRVSRILKKNFEQACLGRWAYYK